MFKVSGTVQLNYVFGANEKPPALVYVYLDSSFKREPQVLSFAPPRACSPAATDATPWTPEGEYKYWEGRKEELPAVTFEVQGQPKGVDEAIPLDARLVMQLYMTTRNDYGAECLADAGSVSLELAETALNRPVALPFVIQTTMQHEVKGSAVVTLTAKGFDPPMHAVQYDPRVAHNCMKNADNAVAAVEQHCIKAMAITKKLVVTAKGTAEINCYLTPTNNAFAGGNTALMMPTAAYVLSEPPETTLSFWVAQLAIIASREQYAGGLKGLVAAWPRLPLQKQLATMMLTFSQYVQTLEYVPDRTSNKPIEMFGEALAMRCGDCEDLGKAVYLMRQAFGTAVKTAPKAGGLTGTLAGALTVMEDMEKLAKLYVYFLVIAGVTATHAQNDKDFAVDEVNGAHALLLAIPRDYVRESIARASPQHPLVTDKDSPLLIPAAYAKAQLPLLVGEGTGMLYPVGEDDGHGYLRKQVNETVKAFGRVKKPLYTSPKGESRFYKQMVLAVTHEFLDRYRLATFLFVTDASGSQSVPPRVLGKGCTFTELATRSPAVAMLPQALVNDTEEFTAPMIALMRSVARTIIPPPLHDGVADEAQAVEPAAKQRVALLDKLVAELGPLSSGTPARRPDTIGLDVDAKEARRVSLAYYINPQYLTEAWVKEVVDAIRPLRVVSGASYAVEHHLPKSGGDMYRLTLDCLDAHVGEPVPRGPIQEPPAASRPVPKPDVVHANRRVADARASIGRALANSGGLSALLR